MLTAIAETIGDIVSRDFRAAMLRSIGLTLLAFVAVFFAVELMLSLMAQLPWPWADRILEVGTGVALLVAFFFLMAPVTALMAGFFLDGIAAQVEGRHYPGDPVGTPLAWGKALWLAVRFAALVLVVNLAVLPLAFTGIGAVALVAVNAYLIGREYFEMVAMRHLPVDQARHLRKDNSPFVFAAGLVPALLAVLPVINMTVPLVATIFFVHVFKQVRATSG